MYTFIHLYLHTYTHITYAYASYAYDMRRALPRSRLRSRLRLDGAAWSGDSCGSRSGSCRCAIVSVPWCLGRLSLFSTCLNVFDKQTTPG